MEWDPINDEWREVTTHDSISSSSHPQEEDTATKNRRLVLSATLACGTYYTENFLVKEPCRTSELTRSLWVQELEEGNPIRIYQSFRMHRDVFFNLCTLLESFGLICSRNVGVREQVAIFFVYGRE